jgi:hypothetical protein
MWLLLMLEKVHIELAVTIAMAKVATMLVDIKGI